MRYNFPFKKKVGDKVLYPTLMKLPDWYTGERMVSATIIAKSVTVVGAYNEDDILESPLHPDAPRTLDYYKVEKWVKSKFPIGDNVVEWMRTATACNVITTARMEEYKRAGSMLIGASDDAYIPGVSVEDISFKSELGRTVGTRGYAVVQTPRGNFNVNVPGKATGIFSDLLAWGAVLESYIQQWTAVLLKFKDLAVNPQKKIGFPNYRGLVAPLFIGHEARIPFPINIVEMKVTTNKSQTLQLTARDPNDYTSEFFTDKFNLSSGENVIRFHVVGIPYVGPMVIQLQPEDNTNTSLDYYKVYP